MLQRKTQADEIRVAPNIYRTKYGWRVYVRRRNPTTGRSEKKPKRFGPEKTLEELEEFRDGFKLESRKLRRQARAVEADAIGTSGRFSDDAATYLALKPVQAMPSYKDRQSEIARWLKAFGHRPRRTITTRDIDEQLQAMLDSGCAASSVNKYRSALMSMYTRLDGKSAANPVRDAKVYEERGLEARGQPYALITRILANVPADRSRPVKGEKGSRARGSASRVRLELIAWTGMDPIQIKKLQPEHFSVKERWYIAPARLKGKRRARHARPLVRKPMSAGAVDAFRRFAQLQCFGTFDTSSLRHTWLRACRKTERELREEFHDPTFTLPHIRMKDLRHSFATELYRQTKDLRLVAEFLDITYETAKRYALGAVPDVLRSGMRRFDAGVRRRRPRRRGTAFRGTTRPVTR